MEAYWTYCLKDNAENRRIYRAEAYCPLYTDATLNYYKNDRNTQGIEFLYPWDGSVIPVEVKSKNGATVSLNSFLEEYAPLYAYKLISGNLGVSGVKITLPLYMALFL